LEFINDVIGQVVVGGIFMQISNRDLYNAKTESKFNFPTLDDTYSAISIRHLLTLFCFYWDMYWQLLVF
jgi:hypothetical protein